MSQITYPQPEYPWVIDLPGDDPAVNPDWIPDGTPDSETDSENDGTIGSERSSDMISEILIDSNADMYDPGSIKRLSTADQETIDVSDDDTASEICSELGCWIGPVVGWEEDRERESQNDYVGMDIVMEAEPSSTAPLEYDYDTDKSNNETHPQVMVVIPTRKPTDFDTESSSDSDTDMDLDSDMGLETGDDANLDREVREGVARKVSRGRYACSSLSKGHRSRLNYVYTGILERPLENGVKTVIVKHSVPYVSSVKEHVLTQARIITEGLVLNSLDRFSLEVTNALNYNQKFRLNIRTPEAYHLNYASHTLIMEKLKEPTDLQTFLLTLPCLRDERLWVWAFQISQSLGQWLHQFHNWVSKDSQKMVAREFSRDANREMAGFKFRLSYEWLPGAIEKYPDILKKKKEILEKVITLARGELDSKHESKSNAVGPIHGDFWAGNILLPVDILRPPTKKPPNGLFLDPEAEDAPAFFPAPESTILITDWEFAQYGPRALDIAQMVAELYVNDHFYGVEAAREMLEGFIHGYDHITMEMSWRILLHVGTYLIVWAAAAGDGDREPSAEDAKKKSKLVKLGVKLIVRAWKRKQKSFFGTLWNCVFRGYPD
ncbi:kinase-like domain-containing protein [Aspergillus multicolor]|uniref:uncharacterized protein n=1 Tax=Aspergillus multicolor TaxID=41759 RepID=UPI003CCE1245